MGGERQYTRLQLYCKNADCMVVLGCRDVECPAMWICHTDEDGIAVPTYGARLSERCISIRDSKHRKNEGILTCLYHTLAVRRVQST